MKNKTLQIRYTAEDERRLLGLVEHLSAEYGVAQTKSSVVCALINLKHNKIKKKD